MKKMRIRTKSLLRYFTQAEEDLPPSYVKRCERLLKKFNKGFKQKNEKIHNRSKSRVVASAGDDCSGIKDHEQWLDQTWPADQDQWLQASSSKPQDSRISKKLQAASFKLDKLQAVGYNRITPGRKCTVAPGAK